MTSRSIPAIVERAGCRGWLCAVDIDSGRGVELDADQPVVAVGLLRVVRNEIGVVSYPDGGRYAVAAFTRAGQPFVGEHGIDEAIGAAAAEAVRQLRSRPAA